MDLFFLRALVRRQLLTTAKFEESLNRVRTNAERYRRVEKTDKLKEFLAIEKQVNAIDFQNKKKEIADKQYADTPEAKSMAEYKSLLKDKYVRLYLKKGTEEGRVSVQRYLALKAEVETPEFQDRHAFWANKDRWITTEEGKMEAKYNALKADEDIAFYVATDVHSVERYEAYEIAFEDDFKWNGLSNSDWKPGFIYPSKDFVSVHSYTNEKQAFNNGKNIETNESILKILTRKEEADGAAWDAKNGMVTKHFAYTSDAIYTDKVEIEEGSIVQVKARCRGLLNHGIYMRSKKHIPFISLFDYTGFRLFCGVKDSIKTDKNLKMLDGLQPIPYTIFTVSWQKDEIAWFVNNLEVYRTKNLIPEGEKLYLHMYSFIFENARHEGEGELDVDWIRVFKPKKK